MNRKGKICFVIQRYGKEVNGGAEVLCMDLAERMSALYETTVVTTKAVEYMTWKDEYTEDREIIDGVEVLRFSVEKLREYKAFETINNRFLYGQLPPSEEQEWLETQGPMVPSMISYLRTHREDYDVFLFFGYLYYPTVMGLREVADKAILFPLAHDEPYLRMRQFYREMNSPRAYFFNTDEERKLVRRRYRNYEIPFAIGGAGVDLPEDVSADRFKEKYGLDRYIIYVGRIDDVGKNCCEMFRFFIQYKREHDDPVKLVLIGKSVIEIPKHPDIVHLGFVSEQDKYDGIAGAQFLTLPSKFESLSIVVLEAFSLGRPVLVNGHSEVLRAHCDKSGGGFYYLDPFAYEDAMTTLLTDPEENARMGELGRQYVRRNYDWGLICRKLSEMIETVRQKLTETKENSTS